ncbi:phosphotransferase enzyme family protein [Drechmeria coniospora]|uniref:Phosphotransferase enzyme family protein n=1 Tax=Drechmeria coniospora TaxID=98403 RepID=A0A151GW75_DRECN|nr:phosphotransferase enzyme family protein [Drechmeria coniospora]KYK61367.1 phosphotransferase enzyme family protein [Drechmeria coniospora]
MMYVFVSPGTCGQLTGASLIAEKTSIPIPRIIAYSLDQSADPLSTYIILEYVAGDRLSADRLKSATQMQKGNLYKSLAEMYIQLRRLEFPSIGRLVRRDGGFEVDRQVVTIDTNCLQVEGLDPFATQSSYHADRSTLNSANKYVDMRLQISSNAFFKSRTNIEHGMGASVLYHFHRFCQHARTWTDSTLDQGPFVLVHGDLGPQNLMVNETLDVVAVLDWEWSRVLYLLTALSDFLRVVKDQELRTFGNDTLCSEWTIRKDDAGPLVANALENWTDIDWFAYRYLSQGRDDELVERIEAFMEADPIRGFIVQMKEDDANAYEQELRQLELETWQASAGFGNDTKDSDIFLSWKTMALRAVHSTSMAALASLVVLGAFLVGRGWRLSPTL